MVNINKKLIVLCFILLILFIGIFSRILNVDNFMTHVDDIGVAVDILNPEQLSHNIERYIENNYTYTNSLHQKVLKKMDDYGLIGGKKLSLNSISKFIIVPLQWTYAPAQFILTALMISKDQSYRDILFFGRLPSIILSILSLFLICLFFRKLFKKYSAPFILTSLVILSLSLENIFIAKQMHNYGVSIFSILIILVLLLFNFDGNKKDIKDFKSKFRGKWNEKRFLTQNLDIYVRFSNFIYSKKILISSLILALLSYTQYQILFFIPPFFLIIFLYKYTKIKNKKSLFKKVILGVFLYLILSLPALFIAQGYSNRTINWNSGKNNEFLFDITNKETIFDKISYSLDFFTTNIYIVISRQTATVLETHPLFLIISLFLVFLLFMGIIYLSIHPNKKVKYLNLYFILCSFIWFILILSGKVTLSPTRHTLILLPFFLIIISFGFAFICKLISKLIHKKEHLIHLIGSFIFSGIFIILFTYSFTQIIEERQDKFDEIEMVDLLTKYDVDAIFCYDSTLNLLLMKDVLNLFEDSKFSKTKSKVFLKKNENYNTISYIGSYNKLSGKIIKNINKEFNINISLKDYQIIYIEEIESNVSVEYSELSNIGHNGGKFIYILKKK